MIQLTPQMRVFISTEPIDFRCGIDGLSQLCRQKFNEDPFSGKVFLFTNRSRQSVKILVYDGQGYWLVQKRLSQGRFKWWPKAGEGFLNVHQVGVLLANGNPKKLDMQPLWRPLT